MRGGLEDTICAIATALGEGGIGILRLSGPQSVRIASAVAILRSGQALESLPSHTLRLADIVLPSGLAESTDLPLEGGRTLDEALVVYMRAPRSYTGEDVVEIHSHGGGLLLSLLCRACIECGARMAEPGEFSRRAFLNGRLDLSQAEAVLDTIRAKSVASLTVAQRQLRGELAREVGSTRSSLLTVLAHVEAGIDFTEEDLDFIGRSELKQTIDDACRQVRKLEATAREGRMLREGARVVIVGRPNVGKSSLLNRLVKEERAIVTEWPGTTRDVIEESLNLDGLMIYLVDTAGIRETEDVIEREGIKRSRSAQGEADLQLVVIDASQPLSSDDRALIRHAGSARRLIVMNKVDLRQEIESEGLGNGIESIKISAKTGFGIEELRKAIRSQLLCAGVDAPEGAIVTNVRHQVALERAGESLCQASRSIDEGMPPELVALDVRAAADALGEISGEITTDEILDRIFSEFCIGK